MCICLSNVLDSSEKGSMAKIYRRLLCLQIFVAAAVCLNVCRSRGKRPAVEFCFEMTLMNISAIYMYSPNIDTPVVCECHVSMSSNDNGDAVLDYVAGNNMSNINVTYDNETLNIGNKTTITLDAIIRLRTNQASNDSLICVGVTTGNSLKPIDVVCHKATTNIIPTISASTHGSSRHVSDAEFTPSTSEPVSSPSATNESTSTSAYMPPSGANQKLNIGIVIAIAAGAFVILVTIVTMVTVILCSRRKRQEEEDANDTEPDITMTETVLYVNPSTDDRAVDAAGDRGIFVNDVNTVNSDVDANTVQAGVDIHHDEFDYAQVMKREPLK